VLDLSRQGEDLADAGAHDALIHGFHGPADGERA
jgi:hypothetical protein